MGREELTTYRTPQLILELEEIRGLLFKYHDKELMERISKLIVVLKIIEEMSKEET